MIGIHNSKSLQVDKRLTEIQKLIKQKTNERQTAANDYIIKIETYYTFKKYFESITNNDEEWLDWQMKVNESIQSAKIPNHLVETAVVRFKKTGLIQIFFGNPSRRYGKNSEFRIISRTGQVFHLYKSGAIRPL